MELQFLSFPLFFGLFLFLFMVVKHRKRYKAQISIPKLPPGPWKLPLIGNLHQLTGSQPHHILTDLAKKHGPVMHLQLGELSAVVISSPEAAKEVMKTHDLVFANRPQILAGKIMAYNYTSIVFAPYGDYWRELRKICVLELFSAKRVQSFKPIRDEEVRTVIEFISGSAGHPINLSQKIFSMTNCITSRAAFSKKCNDGDEFIKLIKESLRLSGGFEVPDIFPSLKFLQSISKMKPALEAIHQRIDKILNDIIDEHQSNRKDMTISSAKSSKEDLVDVLLKFMDSGDLEFPLTINNIKAVILDIFSGGTETSSTTIEWAMSELMRNPRVMQRAQDEVRHVLKGKSTIEETDDIQELHYLKLIIKETLRLHPPAPLVAPREARERCKINGYEIPIKTKVIVNAWAIGRDPEHWNDAECFEPERFHGSSVDFKGTNFEFIPFGAGRRICPGMLFGITNIELPLAQLLYHFDWKLPNGIKPEELDMTEVFGATVGRRNELHLIGTPYIP